MSSKLSTRPVSRSASMSMVLQKPRMSSGDQSTSSDNTLVAAALIEASGVRRSWETAERMAARSVFASRNSPADAASRSRLIRRCARRSWATNAASNLLSSALSVAPVMTRAAPWSSSAVKGASDGLEGTGPPAAAAGRHPSPSGVRTATASRAKVRRSSATRSGSASASESTARPARLARATASALVRVTRVPGALFDGIWD